MLHIGYVILSKSNKIKPCEFCGRIVTNGSSQARRSSRVLKTFIKKGTNEEKAKTLFFYEYFHLKCFKQWYNIEEKKWEEEPFRKRNSPDELVGRLKKLDFTPAQRRRRHTIQLYLSNKFRNQLIKAYNSQNTEKVIKIQNRMADYLEELESFGPKFDFKWTDLDGIGCTGGNLELNQLIRTYDRQWQEQLHSWRIDPDRWMKIFRRTNETPFMPVWRNDD